MSRTLTIFFFAFFINIFYLPTYVKGEDLADKEFWFLHPDFDRYKPKVIAVLPMDNFSLEPDLEKTLYREIYERLTARGYMKISADKVNSVMKKLGVQTPGQLTGISLERLKNELNCDAFLTGQIEQSGAIHSGVYDAVTVSCSLRLVDCLKGETLWRTEQWRTAHRQWQVDPINAFINFAGHENASREKRVAWLVQEMLKTLPQGPVNVEFENLLEKAKEIKINE